MEIFGAKYKKKGNSALDTITILLIIFVMAIVSVVGYKLFDELNTDVQADLTSSTAKNISQDLYDKYPPLMDNILLFAFVLLVLFSIVAVFMVDSHPIFFIIMVILLVVTFLATMLLGNVYTEMMTDSEYTSYANDMNYTNWVMEHIVQLMIATGFLITIALFAKFKMM